MQILKRLDRAQVPKQVKDQVNALLAKLMEEMEEKFCRSYEEEPYENFSGCVADDRVIEIVEVPGGFVIVAEVLLNGGEEAREVFIITSNMGTRMIVADYVGSRVRILNRRVSGFRGVDIILENGTKLHLEVDGEIELEAPIAAIARAGGYVDLHIHKALIGALGTSEKVLVDLE